MRHGWRYYVGRVVGFVDSSALTALLYAQTFALEWLSIRQNTIETTIIGGYFMTSAYQVWVWPVWKWAHPLFYCWLLFVTAAMSFETKRTRQGRLAKMISLYWIMRRFSLLLWMLAMYGFDYLRHVHHLEHYGWSGDHAVLLFTLLHYSTSLPQLGRPGSKRKLSIEQLRDVLRGDWMPEPEGSGV